MTTHLKLFMDKTYVPHPDGAIRVSEIYQKFREWYIPNFGVSEWSRLTERKIWAEIKTFLPYTQCRRRHGLYLRGIALRVDSEADTPAKKIKLALVTAPKTPSTATEIISPPSNSLSSSPPVNSVSASRSVNSLSSSRPKPKMPRLPPLRYPKPRPVQRLVTP